MSKKIKYSINSYSPNIDYNKTINFSRSTKITSLVTDSDSGLESIVTTNYLPITSSDYRTKKLFSGHCMVDLSGFKEGDGVKWAQSLVDAGYNHLWLHMENQTDSYNTKLISMMDACESVGLKCSPGNFGIAYGQSALYDLTWNHPAMYKIDGKRVYNGYYVLADGLFNYSTQQLLEAGYPQDSYYLIFSSGGFPLISGVGFNDIEGSDIGQGGVPDTGNLAWETVGPASSLDVVDHLYDTMNISDGIIGFEVGQYLPSDTVSFNENFIIGSKRYGKFAWVGLSAYYSSFGYSYWSFSGMSTILKSIVSIDPIDRPDAISCTTINDYVENSYLGPLCVEPVDGLSYIPQRFKGTPPGGALRYPLVSHDGFRDFTKPYIDCFLNNEDSISFNEDRMFVAHLLHPKDAVASPSGSIDDMPYSLQSDRDSLQYWWPASLYVNPTSIGQMYLPMHNDDSTIEPGILYSFRMAAHLIAPAQLKINDNLSSIFQAGDVYFDIPMRDTNNVDFLGWPRFAIVRDSIEVKIGYGPQEIVNDIWPGGYGLFSYEINKLNLPTPDNSILSLIVDDTSNTIQCITTGDILDIEWSIGYGYFSQYDGSIISIGDINLKAGFFRFRIKSSITNNSSPAISSPIFTGSTTLSNYQLFQIFNDPYLLNGEVDNSPIQETVPLIFDNNSAGIITDTNSYAQVSDNNDWYPSQELYKITMSTVGQITMLVQLDSFGNTPVLGVSANNPGGADNYGLRAYHGTLYAGIQGGINTKIPVLNNYIFRINFFGNPTIYPEYSYSKDGGSTFIIILGISTSLITDDIYTYYPNLNFARGSDSKVGLLAKDVRQFGLTPV